MDRRNEHSRIKPGFSLIELLVSGSIMLIVILGAMSLFMRSNRITTDHQQYAQLQNDVRSAMYFMTRDMRSAGAGFSSFISGYYLEGIDGFGPAPIGSDSIKIMGNFDEQVALRVEQIAGPNLKLYEGELRNKPYPCPSFYENKNYVLISTKTPGSFFFGFVGPGDVSGCVNGNETIHFSEKPPKMLPPGQAKKTGEGDVDFTDGILTFGEIRQYWLDTSGNPEDYPDLGLTVNEDGYLGIANVLYVTLSGADGEVSHYPLAMNIENLQIQYNLDYPDNGVLDGLQDWDNANWTIGSGDDEATKTEKLERIVRLYQTKLWILARAEGESVASSGSAPSGLIIYTRPAIANSPAASAEDHHRRYFLESTVAIRKATMNIYNSGDR